ncbi:unnamed protein product [Pleuronectes platessa]|uniref:CG-1 domain-containing protein n=1 Tax=Pleuronectes platessa TaxID=8262 RepID=A0A9N7U1K8_PLEPL|nr:unnamed protein product [Pleuronectes platessa]
MKKLCHLSHWCIALPDADSCRASLPQNGSMILYNRKKVKYRKDGYCWKKRKDGKTTREDHMKLKVQGVEASDVQWLGRGGGVESGSERPSGAWERQPCVAVVDVSVCCWCPVGSAVLAQQPVSFIVLLYSTPLLQVHSPDGQNLELGGVLCCSVPPRFPDFNANTVLQQFPNSPTPMPASAPPRHPFTQLANPSTT